MSHIKPAGNKVVIKKETGESQTTASGLYLPPTAANKKQDHGVVVAVGPGGLTSQGALIPMTFSPGDKVLFSSYNAQEVVVGGAAFLIVSDHEILGTIID